MDFIRRKLKVGGVLYISYNTQPGWAAMVPMRDLLTEHAEIMSASGHGILPRIDAALVFAKKLLASDPNYTKANPQVVEWIKKTKEQDRNYVAHEYFNRDWLPMSFANMCKWLQPAKLSFASSANYLDFVDVVNLTAEQQVLLNEIPDPMFCQTARDFMVNQQFRRDYWVKGARRLSAVESMELLRTQKVLLTADRDGIELKVTGARHATLAGAIYHPILDILADHKPKTLAQLEQALLGKDVGFAQLTQAVMILIGAGHLSAVQEDALIAKVRKRTDRLNAYLALKARSSEDITCLASPVTGGGIAVARFHQLFLLAIAQGQTQPPEWAQTVWQILQAQGQKIVKEGHTLETAEENLAEITAEAETFALKQLPIMKALQIA